MTDDDIGYFDDRWSVYFSIQDGNVCMENSQSFVLPCLSKAKETRDNG